MSSEVSPNAPASHDRREAVRQKAEQVRVKQRRTRVLRRSALGAGAVVAVGAVAVAVVWAVGSAIDRPQLSPRTATGDGFAVTSIGAAVVSDQVSVPDAPVTPTPDLAREESTVPVEPTPAAETPEVEIQVYLDYLSPGARQWQLANAKQLTTWVDSGAVSLSYHPVSMLTAKSNGTKYSLRAAAAAACVAQHAPETFFTFNGELLANQPAIDSDGFSDVELADLAQASGVDDPKTVRACIEEGDYLSWVKAATERAVAGIPGADGLALTGTPTIIVNGQKYEGRLEDPAEFAQFVLTSASGAFYKNQSATPTPTPTATPTPTPEEAPAPEETPAE
ncbi:DsbA family protein [Microbacterium sp. No. 7]|uniref:DsbA family protein n=1 Tax=Microbacterium sp. No. 7 TaxID=1714373 RepID=UPI0006D1A31C|nr:thioredoxin domain-containing protein [Microbacterium sp. No. 7]ALJ19650.1 protein-disulfide isomerase [Microbacterium sp. No. 7]